ncbi:hypothetical protein Lalb_Chr19g0124321 [Lupinus albus]|uniref:Defensin-like protein n=1 Tax=Lupinus albus TaxID=3870 RepID=A0A6A4NR78_LUPAL|nr:hypothetical protein Lalb_Chr19g0124321 [Lupinus albus]
MVKASFQFVLFVFLFLVASNPGFIAQAQGACNTDKDCASLCKPCASYYCDALGKCYCNKDARGKIYLCGTNICV